MSEEVTGTYNGLIGTTVGTGFLVGGTPVVTQFCQVKIDKVANGWIVEIGCKKFVGTNWESVEV